MDGALPSWQSLEQHLTAARWKAQPLASSRLTFTAPGSERVIEARAVTFPSGSEWLALSCFVCPVARLRFRPALVANAELDVGGLAVSDDEARLRQTVPFACLTVATFEHVVHALAATADLLGAALAAADGNDERPFAYAFR